MERRVFRNEIKYIISEPSFLILKSRLSAVLETDSHSMPDGGYFIRSLYFDDIDFASFHDKLDGLEKRRKYRIRYYNLDDSFIAFEKKERNGNYMVKSAVRISREEAEMIASCDFDSFLSDDRALLREISVYNTACRLQPAVTVDYYRYSFCYPLGDVRITLDRFVKSGINSFDIFDPNLLSVPVYEDGEVILEVKFNEVLPSHIKDILSDIPAELCANSKYCRALEITC